MPPPPPHPLYEILCVYQFLPVKSIPKPKFCPPTPPHPHLETLIHGNSYAYDYEVLVVFLCRWAKNCDKTFKANYKSLKVCTEMKSLTDNNYNRGVLSLLYRLLQEVTNLLQGARDAFHSLNKSDDDDVYWCDSDLDDDSELSRVENLNVAHCSNS